MSAAPTITTERLRLRPYTMGDWTRYRDMLAGPRSVFLGGPFDEIDAWGWFTSELAQWELLGHGALHADRLSDGKTVAQANLNRPPNWPQEELGFWTYGGHERHGYASEAALGLRDWYYANHPAPVRLVSYVHPDNAASMQLLTKLGAKAEPSIPAPHQGWVAFRHPAPEAAP